MSKNRRVRKRDLRLLIEHYVSADTKQKVGEARAQMLAVVANDLDFLVRGGRIAP